MADTLTHLQNSDNIEYIFCDDFGMNELKCIEIEPCMLEDLQNGKLEIRGDAEDETILVSATKSYKIRQHDSSNTILLTSDNSRLHKGANPDAENQGDDNGSGMVDLDLDHNREDIFSAVSCMYVLTEQPPRLNKLHQVLYQRPYKGACTPAQSVDIDGDDADSAMAEADHAAAASSAEKVDLSLEGLKLIVQCSDRELIEGLEAVNALEIAGEWRIIDEAYLFACFQDLLYCIMEHKVDITKFRAEQLHQNTLEFPREITEHCIKINSVSRKPDAQGFWALDETKLCVFCAKQILTARAAKGRKDGMPDSAFKEQWAEAMPYGVVPKEEMLVGHLLALQSKKQKQRVWHIFEEKSLHLEPKQRFKQLFQRKDEWTLELITPYLLSLLNAGHKADKLLMRHARMVRTKDKAGNETRIYISRSAKKN